MTKSKGCFEHFTQKRGFKRGCNSKNSFPIVSWPCKHRPKIIKKWKWLIDPREDGNGPSMCINPCSAYNPPPYQLSPHRSQPKASVIPSLKAQINVPSVFKLRRLNMEILLITARHVIVTESVVCPLRKSNRLRESDIWVTTRVLSFHCACMCVSISVAFAFISDRLPESKWVYGTLPLSKSRKSCHICTQHSRQTHKNNDYIVQTTVCFINNQWNVILISLTHTHRITEHFH